MAAVGLKWTSGISPSLFSNHSLFSSIRLSRSANISQILYFSNHSNSVRPPLLRRPLPIYEARAWSRTGADLPLDPIPAKSVDILNKETDVLAFNSYGAYGFVLNNGERVLGPIVAFRRTILSWHVRSVSDITPYSLLLFTLIHPKIDILVLGVGQSENISKLSREALDFLHKHNIRLEILPTEHAVEIYNYLNNERRLVACALIPPEPPSPERVAAMLEATGGRAVPLSGSAGPYTEDLISLSLRKQVDIEAIEARIEQEEQEERERLAAIEAQKERAAVQFRVIERRTEETLTPPALDTSSSESKSKDAPRISSPDSSSSTPLKSSDPKNSKA